MVARLFCPPHHSREDSGSPVNGADLGDHLHEEEMVLNALHHVETIVHHLELKLELLVSLQCLLNVQHPVRPVAGKMLVIAKVFPHQDTHDVLPTRDELPGDKPSTAATSTRACVLYKVWSSGLCKWILGELFMENSHLHVPLGQAVHGWAWDEVATLPREVPLGVKAKPPMLAALMDGGIQHYSLTNIKCQLSVLVVLGVAGRRRGTPTTEKLVGSQHPAEDSLGDTRRMGLGGVTKGSHVVDKEDSCVVTDNTRVS